MKKKQQCLLKSKDIVEILIRIIKINTLICLMIPFNTTLTQRKFVIGGPHGDGFDWKKNYCRYITVERGLTVVARFLVKIK
jgi:hypothetical protein